MGNATEETLSGYQKSTKIQTLLDTTSPAAAGYAVSDGVSGFARAKVLMFVATLTGATGGNLNAIIEDSPDGGTTWFEYLRFTQVSAAAAAATTAFCPAAAGALTAIGVNLTTTMVLSSGTSRSGQWCDMLRVRLVAGSGTSAGAAQLVKVVTLLGAM